MPKTMRIQFPGAVYHIYSRGNEKKIIFKSDNDRSRFMEILTRVKVKFPFELYAYTLMPNHYHMLLMTPGGNIGQIMQALNSAYASFFNWKYKRVGHLYQSNYKSILVDDNAYFMDLTRYIHLNPAELLSGQKLESYKWSSLGQYTDSAAKGPADTGKLRNLFGCSGRDFVRRYRMFLAEGGRLDDEQIRMDMFDKIAIGSAEFIGKIEREFIKRGKKAPGKLIAQKKCSAEDVIKTVCAVFKVNRAEIIKKKGRSNYAKKAAVYLADKLSSAAGDELCAFFGNIHRSSIRRILKSTEKELASDTELSSLIAQAERELTQQIGSDPKCCIGGNIGK